MAIRSARVLVMTPDLLQAWFMQQARSRTRPPETISPIRTLTTSQPRSLLSMAKSNSARSRNRLCWSSQKRIAQTCCCFSARLAPISRPSFQGRSSWKGGVDGLVPHHSAPSFRLHRSSVCTRYEFTVRNCGCWALGQRMIERLD